jgi:hypothetical protein
MDLGKVLADLREELETLNAAIRSLERLQKVKPRRSGVQVATGRGVRSSGPQETRRLKRRPRE